MKVRDIKYKVRTYIQYILRYAHYIPPSSSNMDAKAGESVMIDKSPYEKDKEIFREDTLLSIELPCLWRLLLLLLLSVSLDSEEFPCARSRFHGNSGFCM